MEHAEKLKIYMIAKIRKIKEIMMEGEIIEPLEFHPERMKACGCMYSAKMVVLYKGIKIWFEMWYHHQSNEPMIEEEVLANIDISGIETDGRYYDVYWHAIRLAGKYFLHKIGWFGYSDDMHKIQAHRLIGSRGEYLMSASKKDEDELIELGFIRLPDLDYV